MLRDVLRWAGKFRNSERNRRIDHWEIRAALRQPLDDTVALIEFRTYPNDEIAVRFHLRLVVIHPFPNGNVRHARFMADLLAIWLGERRFCWGRGSLESGGELRRRYIEALQSADRHEVRMLVEFARA